MKNREIFINEEFSFLTNFVNSVPKIFEKNGEIIYDARNQIRVFELPSGEKINVKRFKKPIFLQRIIYTFFRKPKAVRAFENAKILTQKSIPTPEPVGYIIEKKFGLISVSYLITKQLDLKRSFFEFRNGGISGREEIVIALAKFAARLHENGVWHKDFSPGNILFDFCGEDIKFALVDINRMNFREISVAEGCKNFARLWGKKDFFSLIAKTYAHERGADENFCREEILKAREKFWKHRNHSYFEYE